MSTNSLFAKLLATENINIVHGAINTAYFDMKNRTLGLPNWNEPTVYDLLVGHEVGHALYTPAYDGWLDLKTHKNTRNDVPIGFYNIVEDIRIERMIQETYPGLTSSFLRGYRFMKNKDMFGIGKKEHITITDYNFIDRLNLKAKLRSLIEVDFKKEEIPYINMAHAASTFAEMKKAAEAIFDFVKDQIKEQASTTIAIPAECNESSTSLKDADEYSDSDDSGDSSGDNDDDASGDASGDASDASDAGDASDSSGDDSDDSDDSDDAGDGDGGDGDSYEEIEGGFLSDECYPIEPGTEGGRHVGAEGGANPLKYSEEAMTVDSITDNEYEKNKSQSLIERTKNGSLLRISYGYSKRQLESVIVPYELVKKARKNTIVPTLSSTKKFKQENKECVATLAREFEMKKAAYMYARATISKTGSLDMSKLHQYKHTDDIFLKTTKLAEAKNHGMVMCIDYSGSMAPIIKNVLSQVLQLSMFCDKVGIPYKIMGFGNGSGVGNYSSMLKEDTINHRGSHVFELLSSDMKKPVFDEAFSSLVFQYNILTEKTSYSNPFIGYESLQGTPLNEALIALHDVCKEFRIKHNVQKMTLVTLTDGDGAGIHYFPDRPEKMFIHGKKITINGGPKDMSRSLVANIRNLGYADKIVNFFITSPYYAGTGHGIGVPKDIDYREITSLKNKNASELKKNGCFVAKDCDGYDLRIVVSGKSSVMTGESAKELKIKSGDSKRKIETEFKKFAGSNKKNRIVATKFSEIIA